MKTAVKAFQSILLTFQKHLPLNVEPDLVEKWDYLYERSLGCVGILKDWLTRSLGDALEQKDNTITDKHLKRKAMPVAQCQKILEEILEGEKYFAETQEKISNLRKSLGRGD